MSARQSQLVAAYCAARALYAIGLIAAPGKAAKPWLGELPDAPGRIATRGLGARELVLCLGATAAARSGESPHWWLAACAGSDVVDLVATVTANGAELPPKSKRGTVLAAGAFGTAATILALRNRS